MSKQKHSYLKAKAPQNKRAIKEKQEKV